MEAQSRRVGEWIIDQDVPLPSARAPKKTKYPFAEMEVGESFLIPKKKTDNCRSAANQFSRRHQPEWRFSVYKENEKQSRCWRIE